MAKYVVIGLGSSGLSAVNFLIKHGYDVAVTDENPNPPLAGKLPAGVATAFGGIDEQLLLAADKIVISPGIDPATLPVVSAKKAGVPVISDIHLFAETLREQDKMAGKNTPIVAITGSNAKSTVTTLVGEMAKNAGINVGVGGNIGTPALDLLAIKDLQMVVLELSSFQLEHVTDLGASVATILNLSADHLDRHKDMDGYLAQKLRIFDKAEKAVICQDDADLAKKCQEALFANSSSDSIITTSGQICGDCHADFCLVEENEEIYLCQKDKHGAKNLLLSAGELKIKGKHNLLNALSALALGSAVGLSMPAMLETLKNFGGLPHRCEFVAQVNEKAYFNDSKGTNIGSTLAAIDGLGAVYGEGSLALILGGQGKGQDFRELAKATAKYANVVYLIGEDADKIKQGLLDVPDIASRLVQAGDMQTAVDLAKNSTAKAVLLSPACASFDQFKSYTDRGEKFVAMVKSIKA